MPFCILLEIALQPCGWLAAYMGSALKSDQDLFVAATALRNMAAAWSSVDEAEAGRLYSTAFEAAAAVQVEPTG